MKNYNKNIFFLSDIPLATLRLKYIKNRWECFQDHNFLHHTSSWL